MTSAHGWRPIAEAAIAAADADLRARLAAAQAREARLVGAADALAEKAVNENDDQPCRFCDGQWFPGEKPDHSWRCPVAAYNATRGALSANPSALAQAIERVLDAPGLRLNDAPDLHGVALVNEIARLMADLEARVAALRAAWRGA